MNRGLRASGSMSKPILPKYQACKFCRLLRAALDITSRLLVLVLVVHIWVVRMAVC
jgi:hypothetical protein